ncbi:MAG: DUF2065 domain-containing protein [Alphaproteobacteria bacterium]|nr:DUF2065 domain-containing protein [Alphaproteobacteria bacterium]
MQDLLVACIMALVIEGIYYALAPQKAQEAMRMLAQLEPAVLRRAGLLIAIIGVMIITMIKG